MSNVGAKVPVYEDVSGGPMSLRLVKLRSDLRGHVILDVVPLERGGGNVDQLLAQVDVRDDRFRAPLLVSLASEPESEPVGVSTSSAIASEACFRCV